MSPKVITLTTDFGIKDPYVAEMKATILTICPDAMIVDVTHEVEKFNIRLGSFMLASAAPYFPEGTIHVAVVDPGVGTHRRPIAIQTERGFFVGPDNGLMILSAKLQSIKQVREIQNQRFMLPNVSDTFHGRDIFAPAAAYIANGVQLDEMGPEITDYDKPNFAKFSQNKETLVGEVLHIDDFGNIITNIHAKEAEPFLKGTLQIELASLITLKVKFSRTYADARPKEPLTLIGSHGYLEIAVYQGNAAAKFSIKIGDKIRLSKEGLN